MLFRSGAPDAKELELQLKKNAKLVREGKEPEDDKGTLFEPTAAVAELGLSPDLYQMTLEQFRDITDRSFDYFKLGANVLIGDQVLRKTAEQEQRVRHGLPGLAQRLALLSDAQREAMKVRLKDQGPNYDLDDPFTATFHRVAGGGRNVSAHDVAACVEALLEGHFNEDASTSLLRAAKKRRGELVDTEDEASVGDARPCRVLFHNYLDGVVVGDEHAPHAEEREVLEGEELELERGPPDQLSSIRRHACLGHRLRHDGLRQQLRVAGCRLRRVGGVLQQRLLVQLQVGGLLRLDARAALVH